MHLILLNHPILLRKSHVSIIYTIYYPYNSFENFQEHVCTRTEQRTEQNTTHTRTHAHAHTRNRLTEWHFKRERLLEFRVVAHLYFRFVSYFLRGQEQQSHLGAVGAPTVLGGDVPGLVDRHVHAIVCRVIRERRLDAPALRYQHWLPLLEVAHIKQVLLKTTTIRYREVLT